MDPVTTTRAAAQGITEFGILVILASACIVGAAIIITALANFARRNYRRLEQRVDEQDQRIADLTNGQRETMVTALQSSTHAAEQSNRIMEHVTALMEMVTQALRGCPCSKALVESERIETESVTG